MPLTNQCLHRENKQKLKWKPLLCGENVISVSYDRVSQVHRLSYSTNTKGNWVLPVNRTGEGCCSNHHITSGHCVSLLGVPHWNIGFSLQTKQLQHEEPKLKHCQCVDLSVVITLLFSSCKQSCAYWVLYGQKQQPDTLNRNNWVILTLIFIVVLCVSHKDIWKRNLFWVHELHFCPAN